MSVSENQQTELNWTGDSQIPYLYFEVVAIISISSAHALTELLASGTTVQQGQKPQWIRQTVHKDYLNPKVSSHDIWIVIPYCTGSFCAAADSITQFKKPIMLQKQVVVSWLYNYGWGSLPMTIVSETEIQRITSHR